MQIFLTFESHAVVHLLANEIVPICTQSLAIAPQSFCYTHAEESFVATCCSSTHLHQKGVWVVLTKHAETAYACQHYVQITTSCYGPVFVPSWANNCHMGTGCSWQPRGNLPSNPMEQVTQGLLCRSEVSLSFRHWQQQCTCQPACLASLHQLQSMM